MESGGTRYKCLEMNSAGGDGLGMVAGGGEWGKVAVLGDDVVCGCGDRTIGELVVVGGPP